MNEKLCKGYFNFSIVEFLGVVGVRSMVRLERANERRSLF